MKSFFKGFAYAGSGVLSAMKTERNLRFHLCMALYVYVFSSFYKFGAVQYAVLTIIIVVVISLELVNSAIEGLVNEVSPDYNPLAGAVKDMAAGAVLVSCIGAVVCGVFLFWNVSVFEDMIAFFLAKPIWIALLLASLIACSFFIFCFGAKKQFAKK